VQADGREMTIVDGLATNGELNPIQEVFVDTVLFNAVIARPAG
jgi:aerobic-type carbon monoxide dehydrogenase small subunit (CoxS/CutS family)